MKRCCPTPGCILPPGHQQSHDTPCVRHGGGIIMLADGRYPVEVALDALRHRPIVNMDAARAMARRALARRDQLTLVEQQMLDQLQRKRPELFTPAHPPTPQEEA